MIVMKLVLRILNADRPERFFDYRNEIISRKHY